MTEEAKLPFMPLPKGHKQPHTLAGMTVELKGDAAKIGGPLDVEDWWDRIGGGGSWMDADGNPAAMQYAMRNALAWNTPDAVPLDDEVVYGKFRGMGYLVHDNELGEVLNDNGR